MKKNHTLTIMTPCLVLIIGTLVFRYTDLDITISKLFYAPDIGFFKKDSNPWIFLYHYGVFPGLLLAVSGLFVFGMGFFSKKILPYRKIGLFLALLMVIGPGLIVNSTFKNHWGRPRPSKVTNFGGKKPFLPVWEKGKTTEGRSFPSGHASAGYYLFAPFFFLSRIKKKRGSLFFLFIGLSYGTLMGIGRIAQGAHFASDVLWSAGFVYFTGVGLYYLLRFDKDIWWRREISIND
jgi:lipid A 4'-phosphatase